MADDDLDDDMDDDEDFDDDEEGGGGGGSKKKLLFIAIPLVLLIGGGAGAYFTGLLDPLLGGGDESAQEGEAGGASEEEAGPVAFTDLPEILVNLNTTGRKSSFLKIRVSLEVANATQLPEIEGVQDRIVDAFQVYLRELRVEDLKGSAGMYRLREELLARVNAAVAPARVNDVLFKEMLVQ